MHPDEEVLASIALGEEVSPDEAAHAMTCPQCRVFVAELRETVALARDASGEVLASPPDSLWRAIAAELGPPALPGDPVLVDPSPADPLAADRTQVGAGRVDVGAVDELSRRRRRPLVWVAVAAGVAIGVVIGAIGPRLLPQQASPTPQVLARAELRTLDTKTPGGDVELLAGHDPSLDLRIRVTPLDAGAGYLEVWLINTDLARMVSIGVLPNGSSGEDFVIPRGLIDQGYVIVDISREQLDNRPEHSGNSLLRGSLT
jgi:hypothetical protein